MTEYITLQNLSEIEQTLRFNANMLSKVRDMVDLINGMNPTQEHLTVSEEYFLDTINRISGRLSNMIHIDKNLDFEMVEEMHKELCEHKEVVAGTRFRGIIRF